MKCNNKILYYLALLLPIFFGGCSKEDVELPDLQKETRYVSSTLKVNYCGVEMPGKSVTLIPSADGNLYNVVLKCEGATDFSMLSSIGMSGFGPAPGIVPGCPVVELPVSLVAKDKGYTFSGQKSTETCNFNYSGVITESLLTLNIDDVTLSNKTLAGSVWKPVPFSQSGMSVTSIPFYLLWEVDPSAGIDIDLTALLKLIVTAPIIPTYHDTAYSSLSQLLSNSLQTIAFLENGNVIVRYFSPVGGATQLVTSQAPSLQYVVNSPSEILLYPNPTSVFGLWLVAQSDSSDIPDISFKKRRNEQESLDEEKGDSIKEALLPLIKEVIPVILGMCRDGIPLQISMTQTETNVYLDSRTILMFLNQLAVIVANHPEILEKLLGSIANSDQIAELIPQIQQILPKLETILEKTTRIEVGLRLLPYKD